MPKISFKTRTSSGIIFSLLIVVGIGISSYISLNQLNENQKLIETTQQEINKYNNLISLLAEAEANQRGYLLTKGEDFLNTSNAILPEIENQLVNILVDDKSPEINAKNIELKRLVHLGLQTLNNVITLKKENKSAEVYLPYIIKGKKQMEDVRKFSAKIVESRNIILAHRLEQSSKSFKNAVLIIVLGTLFIFIIVTVIFKFAFNAFTALFRTKKELTARRIELEKLLKNNKERNWILHGRTLAGEKIRGEISTEEMAQRIINCTAEYTEAKIGAIYLADQSNSQLLTLKAGYAFSITEGIKQSFNLN